MEPIVTVNGHTLNEAQSMTLRVALEAYAMTLGMDGLGDDERGRAMVSAYLDRIGEIRSFMFGR